MEETATLSATEPPQLASDTARPAAEIADSTADHVSPEVPVSTDEPDAGHADGAEPVEESRPTHVSHEVQYVVIEVQATAEEISPVRESSTSEYIFALGPATEHNDETETS